MGGDAYGGPQPERTAEILKAYTQYLPGLLNVTSALQPNVAQNQLAATQATQGGYNQLNLEQAQKYGVPLAQVGQQIADSNAQAGAKTNLDQLTGAGGAAARAATALNRELNPGYYNAQDAASSKSAELLNSINLKGLSGGELAAVERANNQGLAGTGNLGLNNNTNTIANAINFGGAFNKKQGLANEAIGTATGVANSAVNSGINPVNIALGQPNTSTAGNFGTGTFTNTTPGTQNASGSNTFGFGTNLLQNQTSANNAFANAQGQASGGGGFSLSL